MDQWGKISSDDGIISFPSEHVLPATLTLTRDDHNNTRENDQSMTQQREARSEPCEGCAVMVGIDDFTRVIGRFAWPDSTLLR